MGPGCGAAGSELTGVPQTGQNLASSKTGDPQCSQNMTVPFICETSSARAHSFSAAFGDGRPCDIGLRIDFVLKPPFSISIRTKRKRHPELTCSGCLLLNLPCYPQPVRVQTDRPKHRLRAARPARQVRTAAAHRSLQRARAQAQARAQTQAQVSGRAQARARAPVQAPAKRPERYNPKERPSFRKAVQRSGHHPYPHRPIDLHSVQPNSQ